ncbi:Rossmann-like and DUF2520 domain-containing protein [Legionella oakridgensis]|uniref:DUF2520 domain-containing protein n=2 Tax=Legionella oakridgensis TaxID=29423 RepID=W0BCQ3_9GAMM|nr:Rossmann-like and DUF2520 domain-containing protein [Legionella oakridgensis]AHE66199.1 hypothetical protein Loa_00630 [Legionella oakridgensis ATCC 33761 = DSM 21215]ETO93991.1 hypothetical protein LOR_6c00200 [Legionella oakridgensis RV-2-2007]KTD42332.1 hypothetical protein Loak_0758 [Legionella oakridgensis]STY16106.1 Uncharacterized conserved protein [Legionella longbeachae]
MLLINIIGAGHLGKTIGRLLVKNKLVKVGAIFNTSIESSISAIEFIGEGKYCTSLDELPAANITFITTPDDAISSTCETLVTNRFIEKDSIVMHCSGSLTSDALTSIKKRGCYIASAHPMRSFAKPKLSVEQYSGTYCALEGDSEALSVIAPLFTSIGSITYRINRNKKSLYHAAGVFASNYLVTLSQQALACLKDADVEDAMAMQIITNIMRRTVFSLEQTLSPRQSLTGPIQRGDISTIKKHMDSFPDRTRKKLYSELGEATLPLTTHDQNKTEAIRIALKSIQHRDTYYVTRVNETTQYTANPFFTSMRLTGYRIDNKKSLYQAAGVFASNYLVTLSQQALVCLKDAGVEDIMAMHIITNIMRGTVSNLEQTLSPRQSLTGPIQRGDISTIKKHMDSFPDRTRKKLYSELGEATLPLTTHDQNKTEAIKMALKLEEEDILYMSYSFF